MLQCHQATSRGPHITSKGHASLLIQVATVVGEYFPLKHFHVLIFCVKIFLYKWTYSAENCQSTLQLARDRDREAWRSSKLAVFEDKANVSIDFLYWQHSL